MTLNNLKRLHSHQSGAATLLVSIVLLIGVTLITIFAARVGVMDQRIAGNEYRHKEAQSAADGALDQAASYIANNTDLYNGTVTGTSPSWVNCSGSIATQFPCADSSGTTIYDLVYDSVVSTTTIESLQEGGLAVQLSNGIESQSYLTYTTSASSGNILTAIGTGKSLDGTGEAYAQVSYSQVSLLTPGKIPPIMTPLATLSGNFTIVPDPHGGCTDPDVPKCGVPISAWVSSLTPGNGTWQTCQHWGYKDSGTACIDSLDDAVTWKNCNCDSDEVISDKNNLNEDLVEGDYPSSAFTYLFPGLTVYDDILSMPGVIEVTSCSGIVALAAGFTSSKLVAVSGDCSLPSNSIIGSRDAPIILVVRDDLTLNANTDSYGLLFAFGDVSVNGTHTVHGSLVSEQATNITNGTYNQVYDELVRTSLADDLTNVGLAKQKYSWIDIKP